MLFTPLADHPARLGNANLVLVEGEIPGESGGERLLIAPWHIHHHDDECFYVLAGAIGFGLNDMEVVANAGDAVLVPAGVAHTWWNASERPARYLIAMPSRIDDLITALHQETSPPCAASDLYAAHDTTLIGWTR